MVGMLENLSTRRGAKRFLFAHFVAFLLCFAFATDAFAHTRCRACSYRDCDLSTTNILDHHTVGRDQITTHMSNRFEDYREWLVNTFFIENLLKAMMMMTEQLSAVGMQQMLGVGMLMDAKVQLETQRTIQEMQAQALKDYQPSENFCAFGTNVRSVSASESRGIYNKMAMNRISMSRHMAALNLAGSQSVDADLRSRWDLFVAENCMVVNNGWRQDTPALTGLQPLCETSAGDAVRANADIHYGRIIDAQRTLNLDFTGENGGAGDLTTLGASVTEQDVIALGRNLYGHKTLNRNLGFLERDTARGAFLDLRSVAAKRNIAENSFNAIVGMKSAGTANDGTPQNTMQFLAAILQELGMDDINEINSLIGENPSFMAQLELIAKRIYQSQNFYANLYDKPENVMRTAVALRAIELMVDRAIYESRLRKEMSVSVLLATKLQEEQTKINGALQGMGNPVKN